MKRFVLLFLFAATVAANGEEVVFSELESGGWGAPTVGFASVKQSFAVLAGGRGGWLINHCFTIGGAGWGLATENSMHDYGADSSDILVFGYGGVFLEYVFANEKLVHPSVSLLIGGGGVSTRRSRNNADFDMDMGSNSRAVFVLEPAIGVELNLAKFCRLEATVGYRYVSHFSIPDVTPADVRGIEGAIVVKFGTF